MKEIIIHIYKSEVPWILDKTDLNIIYRKHNILSRSEIVKLLWDKACK